MKFLLKLAVYAFALAPLPAAAAVTEGQLVPEVGMKLLKDGAVADFPGWEAYRGKVLVVELWGTWCAPCVTGIPHLNDLQKALRGKPIEFISITDESAARVKTFQKKHPMAGTVGVEGGAAIRALGTGRFPQTLIIGKTGTALLYTMPSELTEKGLTQLLDTGSAAGIGRVRLEKNAAKGGKNAKEKEALFEVRIDSVPYDAGGGYGRSPSFASVRTEYSGDLRFMLAKAYEVSASNIHISSALPQEKFSFDMRVPRVSEHLAKPLLQAAVTAAFGVQVRSVKREKPVLLLRYDKAAPQAGLVPAKAGGSVGCGNGFIRAQGASLEDLTGMLEGYYGLSVQDESGLTGSYNMNVEWTPGDKEALAAALKERLAMTLEPETRITQELEVFPAEAGGTD